MSACTYYVTAEFDANRFDDHKYEAVRTEAFLVETTTLIESAAAIALVRDQLPDNDKFSWERPKVTVLGFSLVSGGAAKSNATFNVLGVKAFPPTRKD